LKDFRVKEAASSADSTSRLQERLGTYLLPGSVVAPNYLAYLDSQFFFWIRKQIQKRKMQKLLNSLPFIVIVPIL
jgi:hypothetical protein